MTKAEFQEWCGDFLFSVEIVRPSQVGTADELRPHDAHLATLQEGMLRAQDAIVEYIESRREDAGAKPRTITYNLDTMKIEFEKVLR